MLCVGLAASYYAEVLVGNYPHIENLLVVIIISDYFFWLCALMGAVLFWLYFLMVVATEIGLTSKRIIYKKGLIFVTVKEGDLEEIKAAEIDHGYLGRIFNYGYLNLDARFVENVSLPAIGQPYRFIKALNDARSTLRKHDTMTVVLEGHGSPVVQGQAPAPQQARGRMLNDPEYAGLENSPGQAMREIVSEAQKAAVIEDVDPPVNKAQASVPHGVRKSRFVPSIFTKKALKEQILANFEDTAVQNPAK
jgi:hypothetical protein